MGCQMMVIHNIFVNVMDFIDAERTGVTIPTFSGRRQILDYTKKHHKFPPKMEAKNSSLLRYMLRRVFI